MGSLHATTVAIEGRGIMIFGASGAGKSDLALRLIDRGAALVSDDYTDVEPNDGRLFATAPSTISGKLEVRGVGIVRMPSLASAPVHLIVDLDAQPRRLPDLTQCREIEGIPIATISIAAHDASAPIKVEWALRLIFEEK